MLFFFLGSLALTILFQRLFIGTLCHTAFFGRNQSIDAIKKPCIKDLHKSKADTPSMGGIAINFALLAFLCTYLLTHQTFFAVNAALLLFGVVGFRDDFIKLKKPRDGITAKEKLVAISVASAAVMASAASFHGTSPEVFLPAGMGAIHLAGPVFFLVSTTSSS